MSLDIAEKNSEVTDEEVGELLDDLAEIMFSKWLDEVDRRATIEKSNEESRGKYDKQEHTADQLHN